MTTVRIAVFYHVVVSTHMPLARHDLNPNIKPTILSVSSHMPLARHDEDPEERAKKIMVSTHMPLARHDFQFMPQNGR